jgi:ABC-2 type transport system permease protein
MAAYSIVGEKTSRTLEPLLATPITTAELLVGKNLAAAIPAVLATWLGFAIFGAGTLLISHSQNVVGALINPVWLLAIILVGPLMAVLSTNFSMIVSSRVNDPRVAEQISALVILPVVGGFMGQMFGLLLITQNFMWVISGITLILDAILIYLAVRLFARETILTRWK